MSLAVETEFGRQSRELPRRSLRVLDVGLALTGDPDAIEALALEWRVIWEGVGFMSIINHGVSKTVTQRMTDAAKAFHDLPHDVKMSIPVTRDQKGYIPTKAGITTHSEFHESRKPDTVECLVLATDYPANHPDVVAGKQFYGLMPWLPDAALPGFRAAAEEYMTTITDLGRKLLPVWARSLELDADFFDSKFENAYTYFRMAKYPPKPDLDDGELGLQAHVDTGFMTFLPPADEEGIQILDTDGQWFWPGTH